MNLYHIECYSTRRKNLREEYFIVANNYKEAKQALIDCKPVKDIKRLDTKRNNIMYVPCDRVVIQGFVR